MKPGRNKYVTDYIMTIIIATKKKNGVRQERTESLLFVEQEYNDRLHYYQLISIALLASC